MSAGKRFQFTLAHKVLVLVAVPLVFVFLMLVMVCILLEQAKNEARQADHSKSVIAKTNEVIESFNDVGYSFIVYDAATRPGFLESYLTSVKKLRTSLEELQVAVKDNPVHADIAKRANDGAEEALTILDKREKDITAGGNLVMSEALDLETEMKEIINDLNTIIMNERAVQESRTTKSSETWLTVAFALTFAGLAGGLLVAFLGYRGTARRLNVLMDNSVRLGSGDTLQQLPGNDEIAQIDQVLQDAANKLRDASRKERAVIDNSVDVICSIDAHGTFTAISPAAEKLWGYSPAEIIGRNWLELIHSDDAKRMIDWFDKLKKESTSFDGETDVRIVRKNDISMDMRFSAHWSPEERLMFCVAHDITERLELERFKQQFIAMISHDLRTPLTAVKSTLELLGAGTWGDLSQKAQDKVSKAEDNLRHTIDLINNLIDLEKMQTGIIELRRSEVPLWNLLKRCVGVVAPLAESRSIELEVPETDIILNADEQKLSQIIINLLGNAVKFSPTESKVLIAVKRDKENVRITVTDRGPGIPPAMREKIFERYHQLPGAAKQQGSGLGLAICKAIVEAHGGTIGVDSTDGGGSSFWFTLN